MAQQYEREPILGAGLNLLNLFGLGSTVARVFGTFILVLVISYFIICFRYPCRSPSTLADVVDRASELLDKCHAMRAFRRGEYDRYQIILEQISSCASEIASRTHPTDSSASEQSTSLHRDYFKKVSFLWKRLKDIVKCHHEARLLVRNLEVCLMRASHSRAQYQLLRRAPFPENSQALARLNTETLRAEDGYNVV